MKKIFDDWLAEKLGNVLSSMNFFYVCLILDGIELPPVIAQHDIITWCVYLSQTVIQLIALPVLGAQQKLSHKKNKDLNDKIDRIHAHFNIK